jgi:hypothetical protein
LIVYTLDMTGLKLNVVIHCKKNKFPNQHHHPLRFGGSFIHNTDKCLIIYSQ